MEKSIEAHSISKIDVLKGQSLLDIDGLADDILKLQDQRLDDDPVNTHFEDTRCPESPVVQKIIAEIAEAFKGVTQLDLILMDCWSHIHEKGMSTNQHSHYPHDVSAVYYVKVPEGSGHIVFHPTSNPYHPSRIPFKPEEKTFFIFPSFLDHSVTRNQSDEKRISLSFNFKLQGRDNSE